MGEQDALGQAGGAAGVRHQRHGVLVGLAAGRRRIRARQHVSEVRSRRGGRRARRRAAPRADPAAARHQRRGVVTTTAAPASASWLAASSARSTMDSPRSPPRPAAWRPARRPPTAACSATTAPPCRPAATHAGAGQPGADPLHPPPELGVGHRRPGRSVDQRGPVRVGVRSRRPPSPAASCRRPGPSGVATRQIIARTPPCPLDTCQVDAPHLTRVKGLAKTAAVDANRPATASSPAAWHLARERGSRRVHARRGRVAGRRLPPGGVPALRQPRRAARRDGPPDRPQLRLRQPARRHPGSCRPWRASGRCSGCGSTTSARSCRSPGRWRRPRSPADEGSTAYHDRMDAWRETLRISIAALADSGGCGRLDRRPGRRLGLGADAPADVRPLSSPTAAGRRAGSPSRSPDPCSPSSPGGIRRRRPPDAAGRRLSPRRRAPAGPSR